MDDSFYDILASHYDDLQLTGDTSAWAPYICGLITDFCKKDVPSVTDLGCGTGVITNYLASKGMTVTGVDLSPDMLSVASSGDETGTVSWICADITEYEGPVCDCFISTMDTIGHITDVKALSKMFASVSGLLEEGGVFILDTTTKHHFEETLGNNVFYEDYDDFTLLCKDRTATDCCSGCKFFASFRICIRRLVCRLRIPGILCRRRIHIMIVPGSICPAGIKCTRFCLYECSTCRIIHCHPILGCIIDIICKDFGISYCEA